MESATKPKIIRIANASGYWGDDPTALRRQVRGGEIDYVSLDFLAEITMSILQKQRARDSALGYARDFVTMVSEVLPDILERKIKIIANAGGVNPRACAAAVMQAAAKRGLRPRIVVVEGDDILGNIGELREKGAAFANMETGADFAPISDRLQAANVYFGARPVVRALEFDPDIVITGRVTDTGITLGPLIYEFGWGYQDWDRLAAGIVAGHIIECGSQATGGNFTDWDVVGSYHNIGYPIVEMSADGSFVVTKHPGTGGLVSCDTIREQLVYEMGNPRFYITPDVTADFSSADVRPAGKDRVTVGAVKGHEPTPFYKVSMAYDDGLKCQGAILISGPEARKKAESFADIFWQKCEGNFTERETEYLGWNACHRSLGLVDDGAEIVLRLGVRSTDRHALEQFSKLIPSLILGGPPGVTVLGGAPKPADIVNYWPALLAKTLVQPRITVIGDGERSQTSSEVQSDYTEGHYTPPQSDATETSSATQTIAAVLHARQATHSVPLSTICLARSGDKGDTSNIGVLARSPKAFTYICQELTAQLVKNLFQELCHGRVTRHRVDNLWALNFLLEESLGGGGTMTLRADAQGKTFAQALLRQNFPIPEDILDDVGKHPFSDRDHFTS